MNRISKSPVAIALTIALLLLLSTPAFALEMQGVVRNVQPDAFTFAITATDGAEHIFRLAVCGQVFVNNEAARLEDLQAGDRVLVTFDIEDEEMVATIVRCTRSGN